MFNIIGKKISSAANITHADQRSDRYRRNEAFKPKDKDVRKLFNAIKSKKKKFERSRIK